MADLDSRSRGSSSFNGRRAKVLVSILWFGVQKRQAIFFTHDDVIKWKQFPRYWSFVRGIHRSPLNSPHRSQWRGALMFSLICAQINGWVNNCEAGDLRRHPTHCDVIVMQCYLDIGTHICATLGWDIFHECSHWFVVLSFVLGFFVFSSWYP